MKSPFIPVLKNANFLKLWVSQILSQLTINVVNFLLIAKIFEKTGSSIAVSFLWISYALPAIFLLPIAGTVVDSVNRRLVLFFTNLLQAATIMLFLPLGHKFYAIFPIVFLYSSLNQFYIPAEAASIPDLVPQKYLAAANSLFFITSQAMFILGFGLSGPLLSLLGPQLPFIISVLMLLIAAAATAFLPDRKPTHKKSLTSNMANFWEEFKVGYEYIKSQRGLFFPLVILVAGNLLISVTAATFPLIGQDILGSGIRETGITLTLPVGLGALLSGYLIPRLIHRVRRRQLIEVGMFILALGILFFALVVPEIGNVFPHTKNIRLIFGMPTILLMGFASIMVFIPSQTIVQERTPEDLRGRILSASSFLMTIVSIIPLIFGSAIAEVLGIRTTLILVAFLVAIALFYSRKLGDKYMIKV